MHKTSFAALILENAISAALEQTKTTLGVAEHEQLFRFAAVALRHQHAEQEYRSACLSVALLPPEVVAAVEQALAERVQRFRGDLSTTTEK